MLQEAAATSPSAGINPASPSNPRTPPSSPQSKKPRSQASPKPTPKPQWRYTIPPEEDQTSHWADFLISHPFDQTMKFKFFLSIYILFFCNQFRHFIIRSALPWGNQREQNQVLRIIRSLGNSFHCMLNKLFPTKVGSFSTGSLHPFLSILLSTCCTRFLTFPGIPQPHKSQQAT